MSYISCHIGHSVFVRSMVVKKELVYHYQSLTSYKGEKPSPVQGFWEKYKIVEIENCNNSLVDEFIQQHDDCYYHFVYYDSDEYYYDIYCGNDEVYEKLTTLHSLGYFDL